MDKPRMYFTNSLCYTYTAHGLTNLTLAILYTTFPYPILIDKLQIYPRPQPPTITHLPPTPTILQNRPIRNFYSWKYFDMRFLSHIIFWEN